MKNFIGVGNRVTLVAAAVTTSGQAVLIGSLFGIAESAAAIGDPLVLAMNGIYDLPKTTSQVETISQLAQGMLCAKCGLQSSISY